jgi:glycine/D-amino acid oxidase-like deaminating enzyme
MIMGATRDIVVIGNGALGLSLAHRLKVKQPSLSLAVIGPAKRKGGATPAAGAMLNAWAEIGPGQFDHPTLADRVRLPLGALALWDGFCAELSEYSPTPLSPVWGTLVLDSGKGGAMERASIDTMIAALSEMRGPPLAAPATGGRAKMVSIPDGWVAADRMIEGLERALQAHGAALIDAKVEALAQPSRGSWRVTLDNGETADAGAVVLANGPFAQALIDTLPEVRAATPRLLFEPGMGYDVVSSARAPGPVVRTMGRGAAGGFHLITRGEGRFYLGSTSTIALTPDWTAPEEKLAALKTMAASEIDADFSRAKYDARPLGFRTFAADGFPLLGQSHVGGLWFAVGLRRDGLTSAPLIASQISSAMLGEADGPPTRFAPSRKLLAYKTPPEALEEALAVYGQNRREDFTAIATRRGLEAFALHPSLWPLYRDDASFGLLDHARGN